MDRNAGRSDAGWHDPSVEPDDHADGGATTLFEWDEHNIMHIAEHGVEPEEAEDALQDPDLVNAAPRRVPTEPRWAAIGATAAGRVLFIVYTRRRGRFRVATARDATMGEKRRYRRNRPPAATRRQCADARTDCMSGETIMPAAAARTARRMQVVNRWEDVPQFASEAEEHTFWSTHELGPALLAQMGSPEPDSVPPPRPRADSADQPRTRPIAIRLDRDVLRRLRALAARKGKGYQTLLKEFVLERLYEEEKREGLLAR